MESKPAIVTSLLILMLPFVLGACDLTSSGSSISTPSASSPLSPVSSPRFTGVAQILTPEEHYERGKSYVDNGDYKQAIREYTNAIQLKPDYIEAYQERGDANTKTGDYDGAIADYSEAIRLYPDSPSPYLSRGFAYQLKRDFDRAVADYELAIKLKPDFMEAYYWSGVAYAEKTTLIALFRT